MSEKITIEQIAQLSGVSIATVSRIINNKDNVKKETKDRVLAIMDELDFKPKSNSTLSNPNSNVILMCVPDFQNPFNSPVINGVQQAAYENGYDVLLLQSKNYYTEEEDFKHILKDNSFAGILLLSSVSNNNILDELSLRCPVVMCSEYAENCGVSYVSIDDKNSAKTAVNYLISTGCKKIGFINCSKKFRYARHREDGFKQALYDSGLEFNQNWMANVSSINYNLALSRATHILSLPDRPNGIFTSSDVFGLAVIKAAHNLGLRVPEDVSVVGFDNIDLSIISTPSLTTIEQPTYQLGYQSCELLLEKIKNPDTLDKQIILDTELIVRSSTKLL